MRYSIVPELVTSEVRRRPPLCSQGRFGAAFLAAKAIRIIMFLYNNKEQLKYFPKVFCYFLSLSAWAKESRKMQKNVRTLYIRYRSSPTSICGNRILRSITAMLVTNKSILHKILKLRMVAILSLLGTCRLLSD